METKQVDIEEVIGERSQEPEGKSAESSPEAPTTSTTTTDLAKLPAWGVGEGFVAEYERIAVRVAGAMTLPKGLTEDSDHKPYPLATVSKNVLSVALAGRELGVGFFEAMRHIHIINGQTALSSEVKMALAKRAGLVIEDVDETNGCKITAHRQDTGERGVGEFTPEDKKLAKLGESARSGWSTYPKDMYFARAAARLIRRLMPDAKGASFRSVEELSEEKVEE